MTVVCYRSKRPRQSIAVRQLDSSRPSALDAPTPSLRLGEIPTSSDIRVVVVNLGVVDGGAWWWMVIEGVLDRGRIICGGTKAGKRRISSFLSLFMEPSWSIVRELMTSDQSIYRPLLDAYPTADRRKYPKDKFIEISSINL